MDPNTYFTLFFISLHPLGKLQRAIETVGRMAMHSTASTWQVATHY